MVDPDKDPGPRAAGPLVVACLAPADLRPEVDPLTGEVRVDTGKADLSASDCAALEHALRAAEAWGGRALAVWAGPAWGAATLRNASALGAGVLRVAISDDPFDPGSPAGPLEGQDLAGDAAALAGAVAAAVKSVETPALVVCGDRSTLNGTGAFPAFLAHHLGAAQALGVVSLEFEAEGTVLADRRLDGGWRERLRLVPPAVCSVEAAGIGLRRAPLEAAIDAAEGDIPVFAAARRTGRYGLRAGPPAFYRPRTKTVPPPAGEARDRLLSLTGALASHEPPRLVGPTGPGEAASELLDFLSRGAADPGGTA